MENRKGLFGLVALSLMLYAGAAQGAKMTFLNCSSKKLTVCPYNASDPALKYSVTSGSWILKNGEYATAKCNGKMKCNIKILQGTSNCKTQVKAQIFQSPKILRRGSYVLLDNGKVEKKASGVDYIKQYANRHCSTYTSTN